MNSKAPRIDILSGATLSATSELADEWVRAKPFRHVVVDDFFEPAYCQALLDHFPPFDNARAMNENGEIGLKCTYDNVRELGEPYVTLDNWIQKRSFLDWVGKVTDIPDLLYDPHYFGGGTHDNRHGQGLDTHVDFNKHPITGSHRRLNLIVYLNHEWEKEWGGSIELHKDPRLPRQEDEIKYVAPKFNRCVLFETTGWSWHGFEQINLPGGESDPRSRKSVALYFYSETRPKAELTKPHSTIYVEPPLPEHFKPGMVLSDADYHQIQIFLARRDQHLQRLYGNISDLTAHAEGLEARVKALTEQLEVSDTGNDVSRFHIANLGRKVKRILSRRE